LRCVLGRCVLGRCVLGRWVLGRATLRIQFDGNQTYQLRAIEAVADLFRGQPHVSPDFSTFELGEIFGPVSNRLDLAEDQILASLRTVQARHGIPEGGKLECIKAEITCSRGVLSSRFPCCLCAASPDVGAGSGPGFGARPRRRSAPGGGAGELTPWNRPPPQISFSSPPEASTSESAGDFVTIPRGSSTMGTGNALEMDNHQAGFSGALAHVHRRGVSGEHRAVAGTAGR
jgi:hypothetical protein